MEKKNRNLITTFLLVVGAIFILIAGSIFVTKAWQHLSENGKRIILTTVVAGLYVASWKLKKNEILTKTEHALYYLATAGLGFLVVSFLGGWTMGAAVYAESMGRTAMMQNADKALWAFAAVAVGIGYRYFTERKIWDFGILIWVLFNMFWLVQAASVHELYGVLPIGAMALLLAFQYRETGNIGYRVVQSITLIFLNHYFIYYLSDLMMLENAHGMWEIYVGILLDAAYVIWLQRKELTYLYMAINWFMCLLQLVAGVFEWEDAEMHITKIVPFALTAAVCFAILRIRENEEQYGKLSVIYGLMSALSGIIFLTAQTYSYDSMNGWKHFQVALMCGLLMTVFLVEMIDSLIVNDTAKRVLKSLSLLLGELAAFCFTNVVAPQDFAIEIASVFVGVGIVLLGTLWYDRIEEIRVVQFILTCMTLFTLLMHNLAVEELANLMFLGITGIVMLIVAAMRNQKNYVIASSVTLSLLALYLTREFWLSIEWWVYLFAAGVILVGIAVKKEKEA